MIKALFLLLAGIVMATAATAAPIALEKAPFRADEDAEYQPNTEGWGLMRNRYFLGTYLRREATIRDLTQVDVYEVPAEGRATVDKDFCEKSAEVAVGAIMGPVKIKSLKILNLVRGYACEVVVNDLSPKAVIAEHRVYVIFFHTRSYVFAVHLTRNYMNNQSGEILNFLQKLIMNHGEQFRTPNSVPKEESKKADTPKIKPASKKK